MRKILLLFLIFLLSTDIVEAKAKLEGDAFDGDIVISFTGDLSYATYVDQRVKKYGINYLLDEVREIFRADDLTLINLETAITDKTAPANPKKEYNFRSTSKLAKELKHSSIDIVALSNNHVLDYGIEGFKDTLRLLDNEGVVRIGGGYNLKDAKELKIIEVKNKKIGFLNYSRVVPNVSWYALKNRPGILGGYDSQLKQVVKDVKSAKENVDILIVSMHWGKEPKEEVRKEEIKAGRLLIDSGADMVIGHHPHILQGAEFYNGGAIFYSLGNFLFPNMGGLHDKSAILQMNISPEGKKSFKMIPVAIKDCRPVILNDIERQKEIERINKIFKPFKLQIDMEGKISEISIAS